MRGGNNGSMPSKIYFYQVGDSYYGPYTNKPTFLLKKKLIGELIILNNDRKTRNHCLGRHPW